MAHELFGEISAPSVKVGSQAWYTVPLSIAAHVVIVAVVVIVPLAARDLLPLPQRLPGVFVAQKAPELPPSPPAVSAAPRTAVTPSSSAVLTEAASEIKPESPVPSVVTSNAVEGGLGEVGAALGAGLVNIPGPPSPPAAPAPAPALTAPLRPGGHIKYPAKVHHVAPVYPRMAQDAKVSGVVILEAVIGTDGRVQDVRVLRSRPLLDQAAIDAVRQWRFTPTLLNGVPVPVILTVTVNFEMRQ